MNEEDLVDKIEVLICAYCNNPNEVYKKVLERRDQRNYHVSLEEPVMTKLKHMCVDFNCDINEIIKILLYKVYMYEIKKEKPGRLLTNIRFNEVFEK